MLFASKMGKAEFLNAEDEENLCGGFFIFWWCRNGDVVGRVEVMV